MEAAITAGATGILGLAAFFFQKKHPYASSLAAYCAGLVSVGLLLIMTGGVASPFIALWLVMAVFAFLYGWLVLSGVFVGGVVFALYELFFSSNTVAGPEMMQIMLVVFAPIAASYIIWKNKKHKHKGKTDSEAPSFKELSSAEIVISSIADGVIVINQDGLIELINPAAQNLIGWSENDALSLDYRSIIKLIDQKGNPVPEETSPIKQVLVSGRPIVNNDLSLVTRSNKNAIVSLLVSPMHTEEGKTKGVIAVIRDIAHEKDQERQRSEFISTASHEMRTPVAAIEGYLGLALNPQTATIDEKAREYITKAQESTRHLGRLFQDLLTVSKSDDARLIPRPKAIDVIPFVNDVSEGHLQKAEEKHLSFDILSRQPGVNEGKIMPSYYTYFDPDNLREVLNNLIENAIKYTNQGHVSVNVTGNENRIIITVTDQGIGIPPEDVPHLFEKFYRADNSETRKVGGTGLGLYICRRLVEANNGIITVESVYGKGTTVKIQIPRISREKARHLLDVQE